MIQSYQFVYFYHIFSDQIHMDFRPLEFLVLDYWS